MPVTAAHLQPSRGIALRLFLTAWIIYGLHFATNTVREIYPALSLGDHLSFDVSEYAGLHPDIFELPGRGTFINNNPGASMLGAIPYALARPIIDPVVGYVQRLRAASDAPPPEYDSIYPMAQEFYRQAYARGLDVKFGLAAGVMQALLMAPLSGLSVVVMYAVLLALTRSRRAAAWLAVLYGFATPVFYRTGQLNHNLLEAHAAFFAFALLWRPWEAPPRPKAWHFTLAGLLSGWAVVLDYSGLIVLAGVSVYALFCWRRLPHERRTWGALAGFAGGAAASLGVLLAYQWAAFGHPLYPAQHYMPATTYSGYGYQGMSLPQPDLLWLNAFGARYGLFVSAPLLLLALYVPGWLRRGTRLLGSAETWFVVWYTVAFFLFTAANQFSRMQFNSGIRHVVPVVPFVFLLAATVLRRLPAWLAVAIGLAGTYWSWCLAMYRDVEQGIGVWDSVYHISTAGPQLPWLRTLAGLGMQPAWLSAWAVLLGGAVLVWSLWSLRLPRRPRLKPSAEQSVGVRS
jgi:hypothetical protein